MKYVIVSFCLIISVVEAADFRTLNVGEPCTSIPALETGLGSVPVPWNKIQGGQIYGFRAKEFDREVLLSYFCVKGNLFAGNYYFPIEPLETAAKTFESVYAALTSKLGTPFLDNSPLQFGVVTKDARFIASDPRRYDTLWHTGVINTAMSIMPNQKSEPEGYRVFIVVSRLRQ